MHCARARLGVATNIITSVKPVADWNANGAKSKVRAAVEHVFARQKGPMGLVVRTIGIARATVKIGLANIVYNMRRAVWLTAQRTATA
jgi:transposase, IS5 family